jgi:hypothetical protein
MSGGEHNREKPTFQDARLQMDVNDRLVQQNAALNIDSSKHYRPPSGYPAWTHSEPGFAVSPAPGEILLPPVSAIEQYGSVPGFSSSTDLRPLYQGFSSRQR